MMKKRVTNYIKARVRSFEYALNGIYFLFIDEPNAIVQAILAIVALVMGVLLRISSIEWIILCLVIGLVLAMDAVNSAIENLADFASNKRIEEKIKKTKQIN